MSQASIESSKKGLKMTKKQRVYKNYLLKRVHTADRYLQVYAHDRELYEEMLKNLFGVKSAKDLSIDELQKLTAFLESGKRVANTPTTNQINYIKLLWSKKAVYKDMFSLLKFIKRVTKKEIKELEELTKKEATYIIAALMRLTPIKVANNAEYRR